MRAPLALASLLVVGCAPPEPLERDDVTPIGAISGSFSCVLEAPDADTVDLGPATVDGDLDASEFVAGLRTQGCIARRLASTRGDVVAVTLLQHLRFDRAQITELDLPVDLLLGEPDGERRVDDTIVMSGGGGFASMGVLDVGETPDLFARSAGGGVLVSSRGVDEGATIAGSFTGLRMGAL